jgi:long-subunit acyl-CoA synthetase (AMP-forming)
MPAKKPILEHLYDHEEAWRDRVWLTQPLGASEGGPAVKDYTWGQALDEARRMAAHLQSLGLERGDRVAMLTKNCAHFFIAELAIWIGGFTTVAIFPTESADTIRYVLEHSEAKALFVGKLDTWKAQKAGIPAAVKQIAMPLAPKDHGLPAWDELIAAAKPLTGRIARDPDDLAMLIYTSGSTGRPKGVMHSFGRVSEASEGITKGVESTENDRMLSYLPLAHVFERAYIECNSFVAGGHVFFAESLETFVKDLNRARPTLFLSVPRLWLKFQQGVFAKMPPGRLDFLLSIPIVKGIIGKKILTGLGLEHVRLAGSGSAPIPGELIAWYRRLGLNLMEGYAMTEDFAYSHMSKPGRSLVGYVGVPHEGVEVKISDEGEILIKSPGTMIGYYKQPELTKEAFTEDGFFRTGDRGERTPEGLLKITGRVKELFKTAKGKYVAPAPIENKINEHPYVELSCVSGVGQPAAFAMVVLGEELRKKLDDTLKADVEKQLGELLDKINGQISNYEQMQFIVIAKEPWTIENGMLTPTMKLKRAKLEEATASKLDAWFESKKKVIWE